MCNLPFGYLNVLSAWVMSLADSVSLGGEDILFIKGIRNRLLVVVEWEIIETLVMVHCRSGLTMIERCLRNMSSLTQ